VYWYRSAHSTEHGSVVLALPFRIREVVDSNLAGPSICVVFLTLLQSNTGIVPEIGHDRILPHSSLYFMRSHDTI
jgi:hypothetical protein